MICIFTKNQLPVLFFFLLGILIFWFPVTTFGATLELTVTITSFQIPDRAAVKLGGANYTAEVTISNSRVTVVKVGSNSPAIKDFTGNMGKNSTATVSVANYDSSATYNIYTEIRAYNYGSNVVCKSDCSPTTGYATYANPLSGGSALSCPTNNCHGATSYPDRLALNSSSIIMYNGSNQVVTSGASTYYWRSPSIYQIN